MPIFVPFLTNYSPNLASSFAAADANRLEIGKIGGIDALLGALSRHPNNTEVNQAAVHALGRLAMSGRCYHFSLAFLPLAFLSCFPR